MTVVKHWNGVSVEAVEFSIKIIPLSKYEHLCVALPKAEGIKEIASGKSVHELFVLEPFRETR